MVQLPGLCNSDNNNVIVFHQKSGPTIDHFIRGPLENQGYQLIEFDSSKEPNENDFKLLELAGAIVVVRYLTSNWFEILRRLKNHKVKIIYLMDDDLLDNTALDHLPVKYKEKIQQLVPTDLNLFDQLWVTSDYLKNKYQHLNAYSLPLCPHKNLLEQKSRVQLAYFGTSVHEKELIWIKELISKLQSRQPNTHIEIFGNHQINCQFRDLPRTRIVHPMKWEHFLQETTYGRIDILLTPLLKNPINDARAAVKFIDAARCNAAGLYSDRSPYRGFINHGVDGLLINDNYNSWIEEIEKLIDNPDKRISIANECRMRALKLIDS